AALVAKNAGVKSPAPSPSSNVSLEQNTPAPETPPTPEESQQPAVPDFNPMAVDSTRPEHLISSTAITVDGSQVESYSFADPIDFLLSEEYTKVQGIVTFRGNNFRDSGSYGTVSMTEKRFSD